MSLYAACLRRTGITLAEAARLHGVAIDTVKSWSCGRTKPPHSAYITLRQVEANIVRRAQNPDTLTHDPLDRIAAAHWALSAPAASTAPTMEDQP